MGKLNPDGETPKFKNPKFRENSNFKPQAQSGSTPPV
jgi:hypothetical protein